MMEIITVSERAKFRLQELLEEQNLDRETYFLRVGVKGGGCSGLSYELGFDNISQEGDNIVEYNSIKIAIDKKSYLYLF
jgi:iron-sulfur cluster assembly protein